MQAVSLFLVIGFLMVHQYACFTVSPVVGRKHSIMTRMMFSDGGTAEGSAANALLVRRKRYGGSYPRLFKDRYKERNGDAQTVAKVLAKGGTPAGQHRPVMLQECLTYLGLSASQEDSSLLKSTNTDNVATPVCIDCTLGYGGHSSAILSAIAPQQGTLYAIDQDHIELAKTKERMILLADDLQREHDCAHTIFRAKHANFGHLLHYTNGKNITGKVTALLCDLGYSSMQVDDPSRGFTYKVEGPLDMRMDTTGSTLREPPPRNSKMRMKKRDPPLTAYQYLLNMPNASALATVLHRNSDLGAALPVAMALLGPSKEVREPPVTTTEFARRIRTALAEYTLRYADQPRRESSKWEIPDYSDKAVVDSYIAKALQAIRIEVNAEFQMLEKLLQDLPRILAPGGRAVFLTFHSGEDRRVKKALKSGTKSGIYSSWSRDVVLPSSDERFSNPRSKCAKLRWAVRSDLPCE